MLDWEEACLDVGWDALGENEFRFCCCGGCSPDGDSCDGKVDDALGDGWGELPFDIVGGG